MQAQPSAVTPFFHEDLPALGRLPLARDDVDRGCEVRGEPGWLETIWDQPTTKVLYLHGGRAPVHQGQLVLAEPRGKLPQNAIYLGRSAEHAIHSQYASQKAPHVELILVTVDSELPPPTLTDEADSGDSSAPGTSVTWLGLRDVAAGLADKDAGIFVEAVSIANWQARNKFCPRCGTGTEISHSGWVQQCPGCNQELHPRTDPAVIVAITDQHDRILLGNNVAWGNNRYSTLAGFVEPGESLEAAVKREIFEESQLIVSNVEYVGSQPWPFPQSLMLGFRAYAQDPDQASADQEEIRSVRWFTKSDIRELAEKGEITLPGSVSIARSLVEHWYGGPLPEPRNLEN